LLVIMEPEGQSPFALPPFGAGDKRKAIDYLFEYLAEETPNPKISRVPGSFVEENIDLENFFVEIDRDNSDYVYLTDNLIKLSGKKYHRKKNHLNRFRKNYSYEYRDLDEEGVECFLDMQENWCQLKNCLENPGLLREDYAVYNALTHFEDLNYKGGSIIINGEVEAFSLGEQLNEKTAVIHIEKANPDIPGLYTAINQFFCEKAWSHMKYINREQDLGIEGLRKAKKSYIPHHMVDKYVLTRK